jgi:hypothetical protein
MTWRDDFINRCLNSDHLINDAANYGITVQPVVVGESVTYARILGVRHLLPDENNGKQHVFIDVLKSDGSKAFGTHLTIRNGNIKTTAVIDKPDPEPGTNAPMWWNDTLDIEVADMPSDEAFGFNTRHNDEPPGNTLGHHSYHLVFLIATGQQSGNGNGEPQECLPAEAWGELDIITTGLDQGLGAIGEWSKRWGA